MLSSYTCFTIRRKEITTMSEKKNLCAMIDIDLHRKITEAKDQAGLTTAEYITNLFIEYFEYFEMKSPCHSWHHDK
jgi:hypothetical protein